MNILMVTLVAVPYFYLHKFSKPPKMGFYCNDESIAHPYKIDTISANTNDIVNLAIPILLISLVELVILRQINKGKYL